MVVAVLLVMDGPLLTVIMVMTMVFPQRLLPLKMAVAAVLVVRVAMIGGCCDAAETQARSKIWINSSDIIRHHLGGTM